ncbi:MAG: hypothetical protein AB9897_03400 [Anaerolineaceae bacterium]
MWKDVINEIKESRFSLKKTLLEIICIREEIEREKISALNSQYKVSHYIEFLDKTSHQIEESIYSIENRIKDLDRRLEKMNLENN